MKRFGFTLVEFGKCPLFHEWDGNHKRPTYPIENRWELPPMEFEDLEAAEMWLVNTFPRYCVGYSIRQVDEYGLNVNGGDFIIGAVLDYYVREYGARDIDEVYKKHLSVINEAYKRNASQPRHR